MAIEVMAVRRPHSGGEPHARVVHLEAARRKPGGDAGQLRRRVKGNAAVRSEAGSEPTDPAGDQGAIVVARDEDHLPVSAHRLADHAQDRLGDAHRVLGRLFEQLHDVAKQDEPLDALKRHKQPVQRLRLREHVVPQTRSQMHV